MRLMTSLRPSLLSTVRAVVLAVALPILPAASQTLPGATPAQAAAPKVLRYAFRVAETGFDPAKITDLYSRQVTAHIFEGLYGYDHLARPQASIRPLTAAAMPEVSADFRSFTIRIQPGIYFADDPAFKGRRRELVAEDYVYSFKRFADPQVNSPTWGGLEELKILGLNEYRRQLLKSKKPFEPDHPIEGIRALDRYTLQFRLAEGRPRFIQTLADSSLYGAVAREVIEAYADQTMAHPVGTGPFKLSSWRRSSQIVLERNPGYRERFYEQAVNPAPDDAEGQALLARFKGQRLPMVDRVEVAIIEENQPRWLSFLDGQFDFLERVPEDFIHQAAPGGRVAPNLSKQGMQLYRHLASDVLFTVFNMEDPLVGGLAPEKVALRRAIGLATDKQRELQVIRRAQAVPAQGLYQPHTRGHDPAFKSEMSSYDPARANALLDVHGYKDVDGDGWREQPDGNPLVLEALSISDPFQRQIDELWQKNMAAIGLQVRLKLAKWPENLKAMRQGKFSIWWLALSASAPDSQATMQLLASSQIGSSNYARFRLGAMDALFDRAAGLEDGPERDAVFRESQRLLTAYMPYFVRGHRILTDLARPELIGYRRPLFWNNWWEYVDIAAHQKP